MSLLIHHFYKEYYASTILWLSSSSAVVRFTPKAYIIMCLQLNIKQDNLLLLGSYITQHLQSNFHKIRVRLDLHHIAEFVSIAIST